MSARPSLAPKGQRAVAGDRRRIGVSPGAAAAELSGLLSALSEVFPVVFEGRDFDELDGLDGMLAIGADASTADGPPVETLVTAAPAALTGGTRAVEFADTAEVARALRGRALMEELPAGQPPLAWAGSDLLLAARGGAPVWWRKRGRGAGVDVSAFCLPALAPGETLREHLRAGRFMGLVPVLHFLRKICRGVDWSPPPLRAAFVIDDPNLHWPSYGFVRYRGLIAHAAAHGYHAAMAMVPLDGWLVDRRAAALLRDDPGSISLLMHGNDHRGRELGRLSGDRVAELAVAHALRRIAAFERRARVRVARVMAPPHGACSEAALRAMFRLGFDAACISRPYPWRDGLPAPSAVAGWRPAELVAGGIPVLPRYHLERPREELVFRALLGQPLILYGHHGDLSGGLDAFARAAADIAELGEVRWGPLDWIAASNYSTRPEGDVLGVRLHSRRARVEVPRDVSAVRVQVDAMVGEALWGCVACDGQRAPLERDRGGWISPPLQVRAGSEVEVSLAAAEPLLPEALANTRPGVWPIARRLLTESRDRARPLLARARASALR